MFSPAYEFIVGHSLDIKGVREKAQRGRVSRAERRLVCLLGPACVGVSAIARRKKHNRNSPCGTLDSSFPFHHCPALSITIPITNKYSHFI